MTTSLFKSASGLLHRLTQEGKDSRNAIMSKLPYISNADGKVETQEGDLYLTIGNVHGTPLAMTLLTPGLTVGQLQDIISGSNIFPIIYPGTPSSPARDPPARKFTFILLYGNKILSDPALRLVDLKVQPGETIRIMETFRRQNN